MEPEVTTNWDDGSELTLYVRLQTAMTKQGRLVGTYLLSMLFCAIVYVMAKFGAPREFPHFAWMGVIGAFGFLKHLL